MQDALWAVVDAYLPDPSESDYEAVVFAAERSRQREKKSSLYHNLKAMCGFGTQQPHAHMHQIANWQLLEKCTWLCKEGSAELVPLVGTPEWRYKKVLQERGDVQFALSSLKKLAPARCGKAKLTHVGIWKVTTPPLDLVRELPDGACLTDVNLLVIARPAVSREVSLPKPASVA